MRFAKVEAKKKSVHVAEQILKAIQKGAYQIGDRLPPERELAVQMGVSRTAVREALSALQLAGVIESKTGSGSFIRLTGTRARTRRAVPFYPLAVEKGRENHSPAHIWEARRILAGQVAELAVERLTIKALRKLKKILSQMQALAANKDYDSYSEACEAFHLAIAEATGNPVIVQAMSFLFDVAKREWGKQVRRGYYAATGGDIGQCFELHCKIVRAMEKRDKERVKELLRALFRDIKENFWGQNEHHLRKEGPSRDTHDQPPRDDERARS